MRGRLLSSKHTSGLRGGCTKTCEIDTFDVAAWRQGYSRVRRRWPSPCVMWWRGEKGGKMGGGMLSQQKAMWKSSQ